MPFVIEYLLKVSFTLALVYLFYQFVLRRLTFYNWNRWYLVGYSLLAFIIPFMNITDFLFRHELQQSPVVQMVPSFSGSDVIGGNAVQEWTMKDIVWIVFAAGVLFMVVRLLVQIASLYKLHRKATLLHEDGMKLFHVEAEIIPFSFHNAIYINRNLHNSAELKEIIKHEFVHIKQKHSIDIFIGELLCIVLWFNPFAWLMRRAMRQNLEFIADHNVLQNGMDKKQYQYLLLKVIGNQQFSVTANFNFSSLKNRIAMMNKIKSARMQLIRFLFVLPLLAVLLLAFREKINSTSPANEHDNTVTIAGMVVDADTYTPVANALLRVNGKNISVTTDAQGYYKIKIPFENKPLQFLVEVEANGYKAMQSKENWGNFYEAPIYQAYGKTIEFFGLSKKPGDHSFSTIAGSSTFEEGLDYTNVLIALGEVRKQQTDPNYWTKDTIPDHQLPANVRQVEVKKENGEEKVIIKLKNGNVEIFDLKDAKQKELFEKKYGYAILPPPPPAAPSLPSKEQWIMAGNKDIMSMSLTKQNGQNKVEIKFKNGKVESYDLNDPKQKNAFENKYGELKEPPPPSALIEMPVAVEPPVATVSIITAPSPGSSAIGTTAPTPPSAVSIQEVAVAPAQPVVLNSKGYYVSIADNNGECVVIIKDRNKKIMEAVKLTDWNANEEKYEKKYGSLPLPPPPPPPVPAVNGTVTGTVKVSVIEDKVLPGGTYKVYGTVAPLYVVDGKVMENGNINSIDPNTIEHVNIIKGTRATTLYGDKGVNGVVEVKTKNTVITGKVNPALNFTTKGTGGFPSGALYVINGKETSEKEAKELNPDLISSISVLKGESAIAAYGEKGRNGAILIITKTKAATNKLDVKEKISLKPE